MIYISKLGLSSIPDIPPNRYFLFYTLLLEEFRSQYIYYFFRYSILETEIK
jgi:hypothetical protein